GYPGELVSSSRIESFPAGRPDRSRPRTPGLSSTWTRAAQGFRPPTTTSLQALAMESPGQPRRPGAASCRSTRACRRARPLLHDARLGPGPSLLHRDEEERYLAVQGELPSLRRAEILVLVVAGRHERFAADVADGIEARSPAGTVAPLEHDRQV